MPLLTLDRVSLAFGHLPLLDDVSAQIDPRERVCVLGRNGSGKSTLLRVLSGEQQADGGVVVRQHEIAQAAETLGYDVEDREMGRERHVLVQPGHAQVWLAPDRPRIRRLLTAQDAQQRRLAAAVPAKYAHPFAGFYLRAGLVDERQVAECEGNPVEREQRHPFTVQRSETPRHRAPSRVRATGTRWR